MPAATHGALTTTATYRLQLGPDRSLDDAAALVPYLHRLGVTHVYTSPLLQAAPGSTHGYDVVDHSAVSRELGGAAGHARLVAALREHGMGMVLDLVPNHMASAGRANRWWWDVLENGASSPYAAAFDIAWDPPERRLRNTVLLPVLGDHYGRVLERGELHLALDGLGVTLHYHEHEFPIAPHSLPAVLRPVAAQVGSRELDELAEQCAHLPDLAPEQVDAAMARDEERIGILQRLATLCADDAEVAAAVDAELGAIESDPDRLDELLSHQNYRLARWQTAATELDYRRFFDISTLIGLRVEDERIFRLSHELVLRWLREGSLQGLRIDHVDGLRDPEGYLRRLQLEAPGAWVVVEKILGRDERLPAEWPVAGTTGYDFANLALGLFVDPAGEAPLTGVWQTFGGDAAGWEDVAHDSRHEVMRDVLGADVLRLADSFMRVCEGNRRFRDFTRQEVLLALNEVLACFPVYRTYVRPEAQEVSAADRSAIEAAIAEARERRPDLDAELFSLVAAVLTLRWRGDAESEFVARFQQTSGPVMAKGVEDTAFYRYHRLTCLNEVGGDPGRFGVPPDAFHRECAWRVGHQADAMLTSATHDTKRSEDVRCRLALLSEMPERWAEAVSRWSSRASRHRHGEWPDRAAEYLFFQSLLGAWPIDAARMWRYMEKAVREAKQHTSWLAPQQAYESGLRAFVDGCMADAELLADVEALARELQPAAWETSLALKLITLTAPGRPDVYQGTELWDLSLVDPDNRRPVDMERRARLLAEVEALSSEECWSRAAEGLPKLLVTARALHLRRRLPEAFAGPHTPLPATGAHATRVVAYTRGDAVAVVTPRLSLSRGPSWEDTTITLPDGTWHDALTGTSTPGGPQPVTALLSRFPVSLLHR